MTVDALPTSAVPSNRIRVTVVDDSVLLRDGLCRMLTDYGLEIVGAFGDGSGLEEHVAEQHPDVLVLDVRLPPTQRDEGVRYAIALRERWPSLPIVLLSQYVEEQYASELLATGSQGLGYLLKDRVADVREFVDALRRVAAGGHVFDPDVITQLFARRRRTPIEELTPREREVLSLMAEGRSNTAIAAQLVVSDGAVEKHVSRIFTKLGLQDNGTDHRRVLAVLEWLTTA